jgi:hypothetical protein
MSKSDSGSPDCYPADATTANGRRLKWQCGCRQNGGVLVQKAKANDPDVDAMIYALKRIVKQKGCECDSYHGHRCQMCLVRAIARAALDTGNVANVGSRQRKNQG